MENIHSETYSLMIDTLIKDQREKHELFTAVDHVPVIRKKAQWALKWMGKSLSGKEHSQEHEETTTADTPSQTTTELFPSQVTVTTDTTSTDPTQDACLREGISD